MYTEASPTTDPVPVPRSSLFVWRRALASEHGPKSTTRLVLLTLSLHMNQEGGSCWPSTSTLATETGLSERAVCTHLDIAASSGWLIKSVKGVSGKGWARHEYEAALPSHVAKALNEVQYEETQGTERGSVAKREGTEPRSEGTEPDAQGTEPHDTKALNEVQSNSSGNSRRNSSEEDDTRPRLDSDSRLVPMPTAEASPQRSGESPQRDIPALPDWLNELIASAPYRHRVEPNDSPALAVYIAATGIRPKPMSGHADLIAFKVGDSAQAVRRWGEIVSIWAATHEPGHIGKPYNLASVRRMLDNYAESLDKDPLSTLDPVERTHRRKEDIHRQLMAEIGLA